MKLPKFLWDATYQAMVQERDSAVALAAAADLVTAAATDLAKFWERRAKEIEAVSIDRCRAAVAIERRAQAAERQLAAIRHQRSETTRRGNATKSAKRFAAAAPKAAEMRGRV